MKRFGRLSIELIAISFIVFLLISCGKDPVPMPTVSFVTEITGYDVSITVESTNATSFAWTYGDGETSTESANHKHTYTKSGTYTIEVTVTNESGSVKKNAEVSIAASMTELLAGTDATGRTWILDSSAGTNVYKISANFSTLWAGLAANALGFFGLGDEYDNEYTFKPNGGYAIDTKNGSILTGLLYATVNQLNIVASSGAAGLAEVTFGNITGGTYTLHEKTDLVMSVTNEDYPSGTNNDGLVQVTFPAANWLTFSDGACFGHHDYTSTVLVRNVTSTKLEVILFLSTLDPTTYPDSFGKASIAIGATFKVKP